MKRSTSFPILKAKNIGPTIAQRLYEIGVRSLADLADLGPVEAYKK